MAKLIVMLLGVFAAESVMAWLFYRARAVSHSSWAESDLVVFGLPAALGFVAARMILLISAFPTLPNSKRVRLIFGLAGAGAVVPHLFGILIGFNLYGT